MSVNLNRMRAEDFLILENGDKLRVGHTWNNGDLFQLTEPGKDEIYTFNILGVSVDGKSNVKELVETEWESDKETFYVPRFDVDLLPVLTINGEDKIIRTLLELNGLEVKEPQTLQAQYKYVIVATLQKVHGRDKVGLKQDFVICDSEEECRNRLAAISNLQDAQDYDSLLTKVKSYANN